MSKSSPPRRLSRVLYVVLSVVALAAAGSLAYWFFLKPPPYPWLFTGAYAKYSEEISLPIKASIEIHLETRDMNSTHVRLLLFTFIRTPIGTQERSTTVWFDLRRKIYLVGHAQPRSAYEKEVYIRDMGVRRCLVFEYGPENHVLVTWYVDKELMWPLKFEVRFGDFKFLDIMLADSNIPSLKPR